ncbi:ATP-binding protein [Streptacidiphilus sp. ASG 303]|uniref:sensor histidine kinase n=1 Tax=Streptacidiphilus sp. ASG 303 TaxID=2896847 RepID=UPI001E401185|nr:ATP-binding protein [Streptacidiphilus sp. ASG 303]MCD0485171.1 ATP-binding protein [Streptacidiphilus sp. ASG 303]
MVRTGTPPAGPRSAPPLVWMLPAAVVAACSVGAVVAVQAAARVPVAWCGAAATAAVLLIAGETARRGRTVTVLRRRQAEHDATLQRRLAEQEAATRRLAEALLPEAVLRLQNGDTAAEVLRAAAQTAAKDPDFTPAHQAVLRTVVDAVAAEEELRDSAQRAFVNIARRVQAIVHQQAQDLREMEHRHGEDPAVFGDLLHIDHGTALIGRLADSIAVLSGARPGRQWSRPVPMFSVLRGAMSRILDYQRVDLHAVAEVAVVGPAAEPLIHALAELLDNATRYSPPQTRVHVSATEVQSGIAVEIEDGGLGMGEEARERAERALSRASAGIDLDDLGETPRLGLAVVGRLARAYGFTVALRPSAYAGVRAVMVIPGDVLTTLPPPRPVPRPGTMPPPRPMPTRPAQPRPGDRAPAAAQAVHASGAQEPGPQDQPAGVEHVEHNAYGLPQRRRRTAGAPRPRPGGAAPAAHARGRGPAPAPAPAREPVQPGMWLAAFQAGVNGEAPPAAVPARWQGDDSSDEGQ